MCFSYQLCVLRGPVWGDRKLICTRLLLFIPSELAGILEIQKPKRNKSAFVFFCQKTWSWALWVVTCGLVLSSLLRWEYCALAAPEIRTFFLQLSSCWWLVQIVAKHLAEHSGLHITLKLHYLDFCFYFFFPRVLSLFKIVSANWNSKLFSMSVPRLYRFYCSYYVLTNFWDLCRKSAMKGRSRSDSWGTSLCSPDRKWRAVRKLG